MRHVAAALLLLGAVACGDGSVGAVSEQPRTVLQVRDADDGAVLREVELEATAGATEPVLASDVVLVATGAGLTAFDLASGERRWTEAGARLPAAVVGDVVVVARAGGLTTRRTTGEVLWSRDTRGQVVQAWEDQGTVLLDDGGAVSLLDPETGTARWTTRLDCRPDGNSSVVSGTHALVGCGASDGSGLLTALSLSDGAVAWTWESTGSISRSAAAGEHPAVLVDGVAYGLDPVTGRERWHTPTDSSPQRYAPLLDSDRTTGFLRDPVTGSRSAGSVPVSYGLTAHEGVLFGGDGETLRAVQAGDGDERWTSPLVRGPRPITYLDADDDHVVSVTGVGQEEYRD
ncbi:MAG: PQQ-binding-like beta-propeller repeat protein [Mycobacteriales bacterium]|nr:PQQ-binding-like beta-propeller repeat protein [Mycobacteriales bacterium]